ncbi:NADH-quinone oxidoreductase subunit NuoN [Thiohalobacter thiocyanaticus]|uniref:NADH-quinone oxidoreductase subunit N n=1 Tax=Thiohalobacter thiocyanaticus TaxID=585455 RepID=A0A426QMI3_9GAMM|nr:NADH-quinone oxidoreductase subunit NuoN [Thiohalobacter thiocyanaticus]RRQ22971.1 NADH-quinone oxidoreductase subunit NuoN [Thiohalobacter thiocyanaticus]
MNVEMMGLQLLLPEIFVLTMACIVLVLDLFLHDRNRVVTYGLSQLTLFGALALVIALADGDSHTAMFGTYVADPMASLAKAFVMLVVFAVFLYSKDYLRQRDLFKGEYYVLGLFGVLGMMVMISAHSYLTLYLGLELLSLSLYAMVAFHRDSGVASEAAMKYFVLGALASGMLLYGMSLIYGITGSLNIAEVAASIGAMAELELALIFALSFVVLGLAFKLGAVPFHMWIPDVYHGAPTCVTLFIGSAPKIAAFAMAMRLLAESLGGVQADWGGMLAILAVLSLAVGNVIAIAQANLKRMLAYSTISHVGFLLLGILSGTVEGYASALFYAITYAIMAAAAFGMIILLSRTGFEADTLEDFKGLNARSPWHAFLMLLVMFSMAGVPPTVGFYAKLAVIQAVVGVDLLWLALVAVFFSIIGAFYYLRVVKLMYFDEPLDSQPLEYGTDMHVAISVNGLAILLLGLFPGALMSACMAAMGL